MNIKLRTRIRRRLINKKAKQVAHETTVYSMAKGVEVSNETVKLLETFVRTTARI